MYETNVLFVRKERYIRLYVYDGRKGVMQSL